MKIRRKDSTFETAPEGTHPAVVTAVADLGLQENGFGNNREMIGIAFELGKVKTSSGSPFAVFETFTASLHEKGKLYPVIRAALGSVPEDELDPEEMLGKGVLLDVVHREDSQGRVWANIANVMGLPDKRSTPRTKTPFLYFDLDDPDAEVFQKLPALFKKRIEGRVQEEERPEVAAPNSDPDEDVPY